MGRPLWQWSAVELRGALQAGDFTASEVTESVLQRMAEVNPTFNPISLELSEQARVRAGQRDIVKAGPLGGVPATIKENIDLMGCPTPNGVMGFANLMPTSNAPVSQHLLDAGAVIVGRSNTPEFSIRWQTDNPLHGLTLNPWDQNITCGGSSGGAAVATVLGIAPIAHGNDIGGSLRYPAFCCGATTVRPTFGRVPAFNSTFVEERPFVSQMMSVQGIIAREVKDVRLATECIASHDPRDPFWVPVPFSWPAVKEPIKVAFTVEHYGRPIDPAIIDAVHAAARMLEQAGYAVDEVQPPEVEQTNRVWNNLLISDIKRKMQANVDQHGSEDVQRAIAGYAAVADDMDLDQTMDALAERNRLLRAWNLFQQEYPLVLSPLALQPPYPVGRDIESEQATGEMLRSFLYMSNNNILGLPASTISTGRHNGVPVGVQITGPRFREDLCLDAAEAIESRVGIMAELLWENM